MLGPQTRRVSLGQGHTFNRRNGDADDQGMGDSLLAINLRNGRSGVEPFSREGGASTGMNLDAPVVRTGRGTGQLS
jgi:hypothetical protein